MLSLQSNGNISSVHFFLSPNLAGPGVKISSSSLETTYEVNGREIKNIIKTALALAGQVNMSLDKYHLKQVAQLNRN